MTTLLRNDFTDQVNGTTVNTNGAPNAFTGSVIQAGNSLTYDTSTTFVGGPPASMKVVATTSGLTAGYLTLAAPSNLAACHCYLYLTALPSVAFRVMTLATTTPTHYSDLLINTTGTLNVQNNAGASQFSNTAGTLSTSTWYRLEMACNTGGGVANTATFTLNAYAVGSTTPIGNLALSTTTGSTGAGSLARAYFGDVGSYAPGTVWLTDCAAWEGTISEIGQYSSLPPLPPQIPNRAAARAATY